METFNSATLVGRLAAKPECRSTTGGGHDRCNFTILVERPHTDSEGKRPVDFFQVIAWDKLADTCEQYLVKDSLVLIKGRLQNRYYCSEQKNRWVTEVVAETINILEYKSVQDAEKVN